MFSIFSGFLSLLQSEPAYLDPGSGSIIIQLVIAGLVSAGFIIKMYWSKLMGLFGIQTKKKDVLGDETEAQQR